MVRVDGTSGKGGVRCVMCGKAQTTDHVFECRGQEDQRSKQMYEEIIIRVEEMKKEKLKEIAERTRKALEQIIAVKV